MLTHTLIWTPNLRAIQYSLDENPKIFNKAPDFTEHVDCSSFTCAGQFRWLSINPLNPNLRIVFDFRFYSLDICENKQKSQREPLLTKFSFQNLIICFIYLQM